MNSLIIMWNLPSPLSYLYSDIYPVRDEGGKRSYIILYPFPTIHRFAYQSCSRHKKVTLCTRSSTYPEAVPCPKIKVLLKLNSQVPEQIFCKNSFLFRKNNFFVGFESSPPNDFLVRNPGSHQYFSRLFLVGNFILTSRVLSRRRALNKPLLNSPPTLNLVEPSPAPKITAVKPKRRQQI